jgi:hypothetical protein
LMLVCRRVCFAPSAELSESSMTLIPSNTDVGVLDNGV